MNAQPLLLLPKARDYNLLIRFYHQLADTRIVVVALLSTIVLGSIMVHEVDGSMLTTFQTSFTPGNARRIIKEWGMENIRHFCTVFWLDAIFPAVQALFLSSLIARLTAKRSYPPKILLALFLTPILGAAFDYTENIFLLILLEHLDTMPSEIVFALSVASTTKMVFYAVAMLGGVILFVDKIIRRLKK